MLGKVADADIKIPQRPAPVTAPLLHAHIFLLMVQLSRPPGFATIQGDLDSLDLEPTSRIGIALNSVCCIVINM